VRVRATGLATYPDVTVVCGELELDPQNEDTVTNPTVIVEVLSDSTERYDRGVKMRHYQQIPTLAGVLLVSQHEPRIEVWERQTDETWTMQANGPGGTAAIAAIDCTLPLDDVYR
jgi:Uma2 family endonuclease